MRIQFTALIGAEYNSQITRRTSPKLRFESLQSLTSFYGLPARAHRHFLLAASAAPRSNPPETSTNPRAQPLSNAIDHCSAKKTEPAPSDRKFDAIVLLQHHRLCTIGSASFIEKSTDIRRITS